MARADEGGRGSSCTMNSSAKVVYQSQMPIGSSSISEGWPQVVGRNAKKDVTVGFREVKELLCPINVSLTTYLFFRALLPCIKVFTLAKVIIFDL
jgi:hypothetical protein